jgi:hypothetical protein
MASAAKPSPEIGTAARPPRHRKIIISLTHHARGAVS